MSKCLFFPIFFVGVFVAINALTQKRRVILIGTDGGYFNKCLDKMELEAIEYFKENGSYTFNARTTQTSVSSPGWSNILCGIDSEESGICNNDWWPSWIYKKEFALTSITKQEKLPCIYQELTKNGLKEVINIIAWEFLLLLGQRAIPNTITKEYFCSPALMDLETSKKCDLIGLQTALNVIK